MQGKTHLILRFSEEKPMSKTGIKAWSRKARPKVHKKVYPWIPNSYHVPVEQIRNKKLLGEFCYNNFWSGKFLMFGYSKGKTKTKVKLVLLAKITLRISEDGESYHCSISDNWRLSRYWFWEKS